MLGDIGRRLNVIYTSIVKTESEFCTVLEQGPEFKSQNEVLAS